MMSCEAGRKISGKNPGVRIQEGELDFFGDGNVNPETARAFEDRTTEL